MKLFVRTCLFLFLLALPLAAAAPEREDFLLLILRAGGFFGWCIFACSVIGVGLLLEHAFSISRRKLLRNDDAVQLRQLLLTGDAVVAREFCSTRQGLIPAAIGAALARAGQGREAMERAAGERLDEESVRLHAKIGWVALLANLSPLLGLLGTVSGMLWSFGVIEQMTNPAPADLAGGIKEALVTTLLGLCVAIPLTVGFFFFRDRIVALGLDASSEVAMLLDDFCANQD
ncbi:MAG: MotA/TolQ/ExbB proton channel family protein [Planctomycetes bacterium]|nr:MotA/TolQ/ExbB proton channel family protein [Planctomycetota bacterium]